MKFSHTQKCPLSWNFTLLAINITSTWYKGFPWQGGSEWKWLLCACNVVTSVHFHLLCCSMPVVWGYFSSKAVTKSIHWHAASSRHCSKLSNEMSFDICDEGMQILLMVSFIFLFISPLPSFSVQNSGCICVQRLLQAQEKNRKYYHFLLINPVRDKPCWRTYCADWDSGLPLKCFFLNCFFCSFGWHTETTKKLRLMSFIWGQ